MIRRFDEFPIKEKNYVTRHGVYAIIRKVNKLLITFQGDPHYPNPIWGDLTGGRPVSPPSGFWGIFGDSLRAHLDNDRI